MNKYVYTKEKGEKVKQRSTKHRKLEIQQPHYELGVNVGWTGGERRLNWGWT
jgi:hypothetical protein